MGIKLKTISETLLHDKLKMIYKERDEIKSEHILTVDNNRFRLDLFDKKNNLVIEIQRAGFGGSFSKKINILLENEFRVRIVHPIVIKRKISRFINDKLISTSYRNCHATFLNFFENLVYFKVPFRKNLEFDLLLVYEHLLKDFIGYIKLTNRRKFRTSNRDLIKIENIFKIRCKSDFIALLPEDLPTPFTNNDIYKQLQFSNSTRRNSRIPGLLTYSLCQLGILKRIGKVKNAHLFNLNSGDGQIQDQN